MLISNKSSQARSSGGEHYPDTVGVKGSNPFAPTRKNKGLRKISVAPFFRSVFHRASSTDDFECKWDPNFSHPHFPIIQVGPAAIKIDRDAHEIICFLLLSC